MQQADKPYLQLALQPGTQYNCYVVAGNEGGLSMPSPTISAYLSPNAHAPMALIIDAFDDVYGPQWFADSLHAGIVPGSYACEDRITCAYIGEQWNYTRSSLWLNDDNCGWGACYRDHAGQITIGNTHDYSVLHGVVLRQADISYVSTTGPMEQIDSTFTFVDVISGRNRMPLSPLALSPLARYLSSGGRLLLSGDAMGSLDKEWAQTWLHCTPYADHATRSGLVLPKGQTRPFKILLSPNNLQLFSNTPHALLPYGENATRIAEYQDMRCPAAVGWHSADHTGRTLVWGFPLEAAVHFEYVYRRSVEWLLQNEN